MLDLSEQNLIKEIIKKRDITCLCHFTPRENLELIKTYGLLPRNKLPENEKITDSSRWDNFFNSICLSIQHPNFEMLNKKWKLGFDLCLVILSPKILYEKNCLFYPHNAATGGYRKMNVNQFRGSIALDRLFDNEVRVDYSTRPAELFSRENKTFFDNETTSGQAEVQCLESIEADYIITILL